MPVGKHWQIAGLESEEGLLRMMTLERPTELLVTIMKKMTTM